METSNKLIVKNTLLLYARMFLVLGVNLYVSRIVLECLGVTDYGIYNIVGGIVVLFSYMNSALSLATTRYFSFEMHNGIERLKQVFNTSILIQILFALIILLLSETLGLWLINNKLVIPVDRIHVANYVFQISVLTTILTILKVPYESSISSHEHFNFYAIVSILEVILKLLLVLSMIYVNTDKLIFYSCSLFIISLVGFVIRIIYTRCKFEEIRVNLSCSRSLFKDMFIFSGWNFFGATAGISVSQGLNFILNIFFGPAVNAARGIALQIEGAVNQFVANINTAVNPQIIKRYSVGDQSGMYDLVYFSSKISFLLLLLISFPIICDTRYILDLWLKEVPKYTVIFTQLELMYILVLSLTHSINMSAQASGDIKIFQIVEGFVMILNLPIVYVLFYYGFSPYYALFSLIFMSGITFLLKLVVLNRIMGFPIIDYFRNVISRILIITLFSVLIFFFTNRFHSYSFIFFIIKSLFFSLSLIVVSWFTVLKNSERLLVKAFVKNMFKNFR